MSPLLAFRDYCRRMSAGETVRVRSEATDALGRPSDGGVKTVRLHAASLPERTLWRQLADEIDAYLEDDTEPDQDDLFATSP